MKEVYIVSAVRTPIGRFGGSLSKLTAPQLGAVAVKGALSTIHLDGKHIEEVYLGNVLTAGLGQAPATQVAVAAGLGYNIPCTLINKVCASGMKAIMLGAQSIMLGHSDVVLAGGMESMSHVPFYLPKARYGYRYGNGVLVDGLAHDGLTDAYNHCSMGLCSDHTAKEMHLSREEQDQYAIRSYTRAADAWKSGKFKKEIIPVEIKDIILHEDEEYTHVDIHKIPTLKSVFSHDGTATAANSSTINDGAAAVILMSEEKINETGIKPLAKITGFADAAQDPMRFTTAPSLALPKALKMAGTDKDKVEYYEINEAFSSVALANSKILGLDLEKVNVHGGAVALGHPLGASGTRIMVTLTHILQQYDASIGAAGICNGGGGASAMIIEAV